MQAQFMKQLKCCHCLNACMRCESEEVVRCASAADLPKIVPWGGGGVDGAVMDIDSRTPPICY